MKRILSVILAVMMLVSVVSVTSVSSFAAEETGMKFSKTDTNKWRMGDTLDTLPYTFSMWVKADTNATSGRLGILFSNYDGGSSTNWHGGATYGNKTIDLEIHNNGNPRFYFGGDSNGTAKTQDLKFTTLDIRQGTWLYLTFVKESDKVVCYVMYKDSSNNDVIKSEAINCSYEYHSQVLDLPFVLGSENEDSLKNYHFFYG